MEYAQWDGAPVLFEGKPLRVLILVLMEYAQWEWLAHCKIGTMLNVLILVLMEYAQWANSYLIPDVTD